MTVRSINKKYLRDIAARVLAIGVRPILTHRAIHKEGQHE